MTWPRKMRPVLIVAALGVAVLVASLFGARALTSRLAVPTYVRPNPPRRASQTAGGPIVLGLVDTDPPPISYGLPPVLQSGTIAKVAVKDGDTVKAGARVVCEFDATILKKAGLEIGRRPPSPTPRRS